MKNEFFNKLNYTLANEDSNIEMTLLPKGLNHVFSIAGSGSRVIPLLAKEPGLLTCIDLSVEQLYLTELRIEAVRSLSFQDFLGFMGYEDLAPNYRQEIFSSLSLSKLARIFLDTFLRSIEWGNIIYQGKWEKTFHLLSKVNNSLTGDLGRKLFSAKSLEEQNFIFRTQFPKKRFNLLVFLLGNAGVFNGLLYKGHFPKKNIAGSHYQFYRDALDRLFKQSLARENFFLTLLFYERLIFPEGYILEAQKKVYEAAKSALKNTSVRYLYGNILELVGKTEVPIDFLSFSDVPSYFSGDTEKLFMQRVSSQTAKGGLVVVRHYLHIPFRPDLSRYENISSQWEDLLRSEKTQMYYIDIYSKLGRE